MPGIVTCPSPRAAEAGAAVLRSGGNAVDAAVTAAFVQFLHEPQMCGAGGMGTIHISISAKGASRLKQRAGHSAEATPAAQAIDTVIDFYGRAGEKVSADMWQHEIERISADTYVIKDHKNLYGYTSITTPGTIKGLAEALSKYGTISWSDAIEPALIFAERGVQVDPYMYQAWAGRPLDPGFPPGRVVLTASPASKAIYYKSDGTLHEEGETLRNPDYYRTLRLLADRGPDDLYHGQIAESIAADFAANGAFVTVQDLASYRTRSGDPVTGTYRGYDVTTGRPPGCGPHLVELLNILEPYDLRALGHNSAEYLQLLANAMRAVHSDRVRYLGDPDFVEIPVDRLTSKDHAADWRKKIDAGEQIRVPKPQPYAGTSTTQVTVIDEDGSAVSLTHTLGNYSGVVTPGLGFMYNNAMVLFHYDPGLPNSVEPGKARITGMAPTFLYRDGELVLAVGAPGGFAIVSAVLQTILNVTEFGMSPVEAVSAPRMHCEGGLVRVEARIEERVAEQLHEWGNPIMRFPAGYSRGLAMAHLAVRDQKTGETRGGADPRGNGGLSLA